MFVIAITFENNLVVIPAMFHMVFEVDRAKTFAWLSFDISYRPTVWFFHWLSLSFSVLPGGILILTSGRGLVSDDFIGWLYEFENDVGFGSLWSASSLLIT